MEFEYWWLLALPAFFGLGWLAARIDIRQLLRESRTVPRSYFRGLNYLLAEQPDKAIEAFVEVVRVDPETVELHFALGALFRRRGEYDRAIRMHQILLERADLAPEQREQALYELGLDYLKAGILDRAEELFGRLLDTGRAAEARAQLLEIYQAEKDWTRAIETARRLEAESGEPRAREIAQFLCEQASAEAARSNPERARALAEEALSLSRRCVRASLILGDLAREAGRLDEAIAHWMRIEQQEPAYLALVAHRLLEAHRQAGRLDEGLRLLAGYLERYPSLDLLDAVFRLTLEARGAEAAYRLVREELRRNPTLLGLDRLLEAQIASDAHPERRRDLELVRNLIHGHTARLARYRCERCGFRARQFHWRCPACGEWESYPPRRSEEFDLEP